MSEKGDSKAEGKIFRNRSRSYCEERFGLTTLLFHFVAVRNRKQFSEVPLITRIGMMVLLAGLLFGCTENPQQRAKESGKEIWFEEYLHDYGEIAKDSDGTWSFVFKNIGKEAIVINRVRSTCGCTVPAWPREPIEPNGSGEITVKYNTAQTGTFMKSVFVYATAANSPVKLQIKGKVLPAEN